LALILATSAAHAAPRLERAREAVTRYPDDPELQIALSRELLEQGQPAQAVAVLELVRERWPTRRPVTDGILGKALYQRGDVSGALAALDRALERYPNDAGSRLVRALCLRRVDRGAEARVELEKVAISRGAHAAEAALLLGLDARERGEASEARRQLIRATELDYHGSASSIAFEALEDPAGTRWWSGVRALAFSGVEYDTNAAVRGDLDAYGGTSDLHDGRAVVGGTFEWSPRLPDGGLPVDLGASYSFYQSLHFDFKEQDRQAHNAQVSGSWTFSKRVRLRVDALFSFDAYDGESHSHAFGIQPNLLLRFSEGSGTTRLYFRGTRDSYDDVPGRASLERDGYVWALGAEHFLPIRFRENAWVIGGVRFSQRNTDGRRDVDGFDAAYDRDSWGASLRSSVPIVFGVEARGNLGWSYARYKNHNLADALTDNGVGTDSPDRRRDLTVNTWLGFARPVTDWLEVEVGWGFSDRDSNVDFYRYERHVVGMYFQVSR
jgi:tetratricopeptide (TPR) repeat protein